MLELKPCPFCGKPAKTIVNCVADRIALKVTCSGSCDVAQYDRVEDQCTFDTLTRAMENAAYSWNWRAADVHPVAKGKWIEVSENGHEYPFYKCPFCGKEFGFSSTFCPNCREAVGGEVGND